MSGLRLFVLVDLWRDLVSERSRMMLVLLGLVWGTLSLTVLLAFGGSLDDAMHTASRGGGNDLVRFWGNATTQPHAGFPAGRSIALSEADVDAVEDTVPHLRGVSTEYMAGSTTMRAGSRRTNARVHGVRPNFAALRNQHPLPGGRFLNAIDERDRRRTCYLGDGIAARLFGADEAVGREVEMWDTPFLVVGVRRPHQTLGYYDGPDEEKVYIPSSTFRTMLGASTVSSFLVGLRRADDDRAVIAATRRTLGARLGFDPADRAALGVNNRVEDQRITDGILSGVKIFTAIVGILGLAVALIGVANVMFVMVEERTGEIGIWMALGATRGFVGRGRLLEGLALTIAGGAIGVIGASILLWGFNQIPLDAQAKGYLGNPAVTAALALGIGAVLGAAGCLAGWFPARRAARLNPIAALRHQ